MSARNETMKSMLNRIVRNTVSKDPSLKDVYKADVFFLFQSPIRTAMCDYVYGLRITTETEHVNKVMISSTIQKKIDNVTSKITNKTFCCTEVSFE
jgi:hypothetical protein